jgi:NCAIR mutase (PurE)-related protein
MSTDITQFARIDDSREARTGIPEIVWGENKTIDQLVPIVRRMTERQSLVLVSRIDETKGLFLAQEFPSGNYHREARMFSLQLGPREEVKTRGTMLILAAGTSDIPVAEEASVTAALLGSRVERIYDVGVAGIHRLFAQMDRIRQASVLIVIAGMEGALPSVVAGLVGKPIVAVPTSIGYGTGLGGIAALLAMLNGCAPGVTVVNIDNGMGAAVAAHLINRS